MSPKGKKIIQADDQEEDKRMEHKTEDNEDIAMESSTIICSVKYEGGILCGADSRFNLRDKSGRKVGITKDHGKKICQINEYSWLLSAGTKDNWVKLEKHLQDFRIYGVCPRIHELKAETRRYLENTPNDLQVILVGFDSTNFRYYSFLFDNQGYPYDFDVLVGGSGRAYSISDDNFHRIRSRSEATDQCLRTIFRAMEKDSDCGGCIQLLYLEPDKTQHVVLGSKKDLREYEAEYGHTNRR